MLRLIILVFLIKILNSSVLSQSLANYDYESNTESKSTVNKITLGSDFIVKCQSKVKEYNHDSIIFNQSLYISDEYSKADTTVPFSRYLKIENYSKFQQLFYNIDQKWNQKEVQIKEAKYGDSGRYYCVYSLKKEDRIEYLVDSSLYLIHDEARLVKSYKEIVELSACVDSINSNDLQYIQWYYNAENSDVDSHMKLNSQTSGLIISLDDLSLFNIVYQCHNSLNGAHKFYHLECSNCHILFSAPLISPARQRVGEKSDTQFSCEKPPSANEPDRYEWFKQNTEHLPENSEASNFNGSQSIGYDSVLNLKDVTVKDAGWYICCLVNSKLSIEEKKKRLKANINVDETLRYSCSSVELIVTPSVENSYKYFYIFIALSILIIIFMSVFMFLCRNKIKSFKHAERARQHMQNNDFYLTEEDFKSFKQKYEETSSIEALLNEQDVHKWKIPLDNLKFGKEVGRGAFGVVLHAYMNIERPKRDVDSGLDFSTCTSDSKSDSKLSCKSIDVAIKKLPDNANEYNYYEMFKELQLMLSVGQHPHIVNLLGYCIDDNAFNIVLEYAKFGNLKDFLRQDDFKIDQDHLFIYAYQTALGMEYLHSKNILHRDLAARNILVEDYDSIKISDFGLARNISSNYYYIQNFKGKVPFKWMSPEALSFEKVSKESDVWSFAVLLWEIYTYGSTPYPTIEKEDLLEKLKEGYRMEKPDTCGDEIYDQIIMKCWDWDPKKRPCFSNIVKTFEELIEKSSSQMLKKVFENKEKYNCLNDNEKYYQLWPRSRASDCSVYHKDDKLHPGTAWLSASQSSFNPSTLTNTTSSSTSHSDISKPVQSLFNLKKSESQVEEKPLLSKNLFAKGGKKLSGKKTRQNPIYGERIIKMSEEKALIDQKYDSVKLPSSDISSKNWKNFFGILNRPRTQMTVSQV